MSRSIRVELARGGAAAAPANQDPESPEYSSAFVVQLPAPLALPAGTVVSLDSVAIDQQGRDPSLLTLPDSIVQTFTFAPYLISTDDGVTLEAGAIPPDRTSAWWMYEQQSGGVWSRASYSWTCHIPAGSYSAQGLATLISEKSQEISDGAILLDDGAPPPQVGGANFGRILTSADNGLFRFYRFTGADAGQSLQATLHLTHGDEMLVGSTNGIVLRQNPNSGRIDLAYLHTPVQDSAGNEAATAAYYSNSLPLKDPRLQFDRCGLVLTGSGFTEDNWWSPTNLLAILGFSYGDLLPAVAGPLMNPENYPSFTETKRASSLLPRTTFEPFSRLTEMTSNDSIATVGPRAVSAGNYPGAVVGFASPQFLVETDAVPEPNYLTGDGAWRRSLGYYQRDFQSGGFAYSSSSIEYEYAKPVVLSRISARLLDPLRGYAPAKDLGLRTILTLRFDIPEPDEPEPQPVSSLRRRPATRRRRPAKKAG